MANWYGETPQQTPNDGPDSQPRPSTPLAWGTPPTPPPPFEPRPPQQPHVGPGPDYWYPPQAAPTPSWVAGPPRRPAPRRAVAGIATAAVLALAVAGTAIVVEHNQNSGSGQTSAFSTPNYPFSQGGTGGTAPSTGPDGNSGGSGQFSPFGGGGSGSSGSGSTGSTSTGTATAAQQIGVVDINTVLNYGQAQAAGTGMVLTSSGEILTNNHVVEGSTSISVTIVTTGKTYTASVVGTDPTDDVAVLQLSGASGLATANLGDSSTVDVGETVTGVGNAGGTGGTPSAATGTVTALNATITASDQDGTNAETLTGMIEVNADIQAGDSGGPLYDANDTVVGMDTAASSGSQEPTGYAIPIAKATAIADRIEAGEDSATIHTGTTGFLGVQLSQGSLGGFSTSGATIAGVVDGSAAAKAGLAAGDTITAVDGTAIASASDLTTAISKYDAGQQVTLTWLDSSGQTHSATVTLGAGPAD